MRYLITLVNFISVIHVISIAQLCESSPIIQSSCGSPQRCLPVKDNYYHDHMAITGRLQTSHYLRRSKPLDSITSTAIDEYRASVDGPRTDRSSLTERSVTSDLTSQGYRWLWKKAEVFLGSIEAYNEYHNLYDQIKNQIRPFGKSIIEFTAKMVITYGSMRMTFNNLPIDQESAAAFIERFALEMFSLCTVGMVYGTYEIAVVTARATIWVVLQILESGPIPEVIT